MADPNTRQGKRTPVTLKIKFKSETLEQFIERYAVDVSQGGIFIRTKEPLAVGTQMKFEFQLRDASPLISGEGTVVWTRENDPSRPSIAPGMGVRFDRLNDGSQTVLERILAEKAKQAPSRGGAGGEAIKPLFTDTPTKVAPVPVQEALGVRRSRADSEQTPLPKPMPFHSDADDFDERAFEEATKVRALDELAAQSALEDGDGEAGDETKTNAVTPTDELAARRSGPRADSSIDPPIDDSAPNLPQAPEASKSGRQPRLLDTTPSPRSAPADDTPMKTKLGVEPVKAQTGRMAKPVEFREEPPLVKVPKRSSAPIVIGILVLLAAGVGAVWWFVLREQVAENVATTKPEPGSAQPGSDVGSQAVAAPGSGSGSQEAGSNVVEAPKGPVVDTVIASSVAKGSIVEIVGTDQKGPAPLTAKLEKDKAYKARVEAPGFTPLELDVKGGQDKVTAKLVAKPHVISVSSDPAGADILVDGAPTKKVTPADIELTAAQAAKSKIRVTVRHGGFRPADQLVDAAAFTDAADKMAAKVDVKMQKMVAPTGGGNNGGTQKPPGGGSGSATGSGSAATTPHEPAGAGSGSAAPANGGGAGSGGGGGSGASPSGAGAGSGNADAPKPE